MITKNIIDITGREIKTLLNEFRNAGGHEAEFDGSGLSSGVYYYRIDIDDEQKKINFEIKKMILIK
ncbi:MAG TPA: hypothetical protein PK536_04400 [Ignavibacteria bacterium]|nr:hypothetical protein [Bacteroidota bacterium]HRI84669.1 hypothetical protein [Ignavibacteria bacterium]HRJ99688.1 hypothetical protein [Ignavibacteria bacterium]